MLPSPRTGKVATKPPDEVPSSAQSEHSGSETRPASFIHLTIELSRAGMTGNLIRLLTVVRIHLPQSGKVKRRACRIRRYAAHERCCRAADRQSLSPSSLSIRKGTLRKPSRAWGRQKCRACRVRRYAAPERCSQATGRQSLSPSSLSSRQGTPVSLPRARGRQHPAPAASAGMPGPAGASGQQAVKVFPLHPCPTDREDP